MPLVTPAGFAPLTPLDFVPAAALGPAAAAAVDLPNDADPRDLAPHLDAIDIIRIPFPKSDDGRGFSLARSLRDLGYRGRLRAQGHVISDQFRQAIACGFDEVEIDDALAARQPQDQWRAGATGPSYRDKLNGRAAAPAFPIPDGVNAERVLSVHHYTDRLFRFRITRTPSFRFRSGEFVMVGLPNAERPVFRAYSIASPAWDEELEFYSIKVPDGPLTQHLQKIRPGDTVLIRKKPVGTLVHDALLPGRRLWLFSTGTGIAPFASLIRDPDTYARFDRVILCHTCRDLAELAYGYETVAAAKADPLVGAEAGAQLIHHATTTREDSPHRGRITDLIASGRLFADLGEAPLDPAGDRAMICGSMDFLRDTKALLDVAGLTEGANSAPAEYVVERAFVG